MATDIDCPELKRLKPDFYQIPAIERPVEKQKQFAAPRKNPDSLINHSILFSKPIHMPTTAKRKINPKIIKFTVFFVIFCANEASISPPIHYPEPSIIKVTKVKELSCYLSISL